MQDKTKSPKIAQDKDEQLSEMSLKMQQSRLIEEYLRPKSSCTISKRKGMSLASKSHVFSRGMTKYRTNSVRGKAGRRIKKTIKKTADNSPRRSRGAALEGCSPLMADNPISFIQDKLGSKSELDDGSEDEESLVLLEPYGQMNPAVRETVLKLALQQYSGGN